MPKLLYLADLSMRQQSSSATVRHGAEEQTWDYSQSPTLWYTVEISVAAGSHGETGMRSACMLASSAFLASAAATLLLQEAILSASVAGADDTAVSNIKTTWSCLTNTTEPSDLSKHIQRAWEAPVTTAAYNVLMFISQSPVDLARLKAVVTPHAGYWLHAPPLTAVGLRLSDDAIRVALGYRLETNICQPHTCVCGATVDARALHGLACRNSGPVTSVTHSSMTWFGELSRRHARNPADHKAVSQRDDHRNR